MLYAKLIVSAVINLDNISYTLNNGDFSKEAFNVITAKSKSQLIGQIIKAVEEQIGKEVLNISTPIVGSNSSFKNLINKIRIWYEDV